MDIGRQLLNFSIYKTNGSLPHTASGLVCTKQSWCVGHLYTVTDHCPVSRWPSDVDTQTRLFDNIIIWFLINNFELDLLILAWLENLTLHKRNQHNQRKKKLNFIFGTYWKISVSQSLFSFVELLQVLSINVFLTAKITMTKLTQWKETNSISFVTTNLS